MAIAAEHFFHDAQPLGVGTNNPGVDYISGRSLAEIPDTEFHRGANESSLSYVSRATKLVHQATYHCPPSSNSLSLIERLVVRIAVLHGYDPKFELGLYGKRLRCGYCSERAAALTRILMSNDVEAITYGVNGHVLTRILLDGVFYYTDPDYGIGPYHADLLKPDLKAIYQTSSRPFAADQVAEMISNKADDGAYYSEAYFESLRQLRRALYRISDSMAYAFFAIGAGLIASLAWGRDLPPLK